jgi:SPP1 family predicted phage head-tail adaptor
MAIQAGRLRHRVIIQSNTPTQNTSGEEVPSWGTFATVWASVEPQSGAEKFDPEQFYSTTTVKIRIRYLSGLTTKMRVSFDSKSYDIEAIIQMNTIRKEMEITAREYVRTRT